MSAPNTHFGAGAIADMLADVRAIYFLGIGGVSMSSLAMMTQSRGLRVGGYDRTHSPTVQRLCERGIPVDHTPDSACLDGYGAVVYTVAISEELAPYREAKRRGIPVISRSDYMGYLMMDYTARIGIAGSHGKSTVTCMCAQIWMRAMARPTVLSGAAMDSMGGAFLEGEHDAMVFEACEYKDSFLDFNPTVAVVLNAELDHVDYFKDMAQLKGSFGRFAARVGEAGTVISNADDGQTVEAMQTVRAHRLTFGIADDKADYRAENILLEHGYARFDIVHHGSILGRVALGVPGAHNVYNALAAAAAAHVCGIAAEHIVQGLELFRGARRRMEYKGRLNGAPVYDDYAHHPTEVRTTLGEARLLGKGRLIAVFQPHTYSRTAALFDEYVSALNLADCALIAPIYAARETDSCGMSAARLAGALSCEIAIGCDGMEQVTEQLCRAVLPTDTVVIMGAGNIDGIYGRLPLVEDVDALPKKTNI